MIKVVSISFSYHDKPLFTQASFSIGKNQVVGLVGPNGAGKSTLFSLLAQKELPEEGKIIVEGNIEMVPQEIKHNPIMEGSLTIRKYIDKNNSKQDFEIRKILDGLELEKLNLDNPPQNLSGGQKTKLAICRALILEPDILLLDEPTNFLDIAGKKWVMNFLSRYPKTVILISHDLKLLDQSITKVLAINTFDKKIEEYTGNYTKFQKLKKEKDDLLKRQIINEQKHISRMKEGLLKMARFTSAKGVRQRTMLKHRIEKLEQNLPALPKEIQKIKITLPTPAHIGELPLIIENVSKSFGNLQVLSEVSFYVRRGERIALIGPNGAGKSTLIKIALGLINPDSGNVVRNEKLQIGYYSQEFETLNMDRTLIDEIEEVACVSEITARKVLGKFMFSGSKVYQKIMTLSGGEKTRLSIALLLLHNYNLLVLDEPTTYLDVMSQRVILDALKIYTGTMIIVSHTKEFITELEPTRALFLPQNKIKYWEKEMAESVGEI